MGGTFKEGSVIECELNVGEIIRAVNWNNDKGEGPHGRHEKLGA